MGWLMCKQDADTSYCPKEGADGIAPAATHSQEQEAFSPQYLSHVLGNRKIPKKESKGGFFFLLKELLSPLSVPPVHCHPLLSVGQESQHCSRTEPGMCSHSDSVAPDCCWVFSYCIPVLKKTAFHQQKNTAPAVWKSPPLIWQWLSHCVPSVYVCYLDLLFIGKPLSPMTHLFIFKANI